MTLGRKLFLLIGGLLCLLLAGQWLLYRSLSRRVSEDVRSVAFQVGEEIVSGFEYRIDGEGEEIRERIPGPPPADGAEGAGSTHARVFVLATKEPEGASGEKVAGESATPGEPRGQVVLRKEMHWQTRLPPPEEGAATDDGREKRPFAIDADEGRDVLFLRGPQVARTIPIPGRRVASTLERFGSQLLLGNLALLAVGLAAAAWLAHRMTRPLAALAATAERVGEGELGAAVVESATHRPDEPGGGLAAGDEITRAVASFNRMSSRLAELDRENRRLAEAEQLSELGDVARGLAHSLRNPLNALGLSIERLGARVPEDDSTADLVDGSRRQIRRIDGALRSFLALASSGGVESEPVDLAALARETALEALHDSAGAAGGRGAANGGRAPRVEVDSAAGERFVVAGVAAELKAILQALVVNACEAGRANPDGEADPGLVRIRLAPGRGERGERAGGVTIVVEDDGPGIPESVRARLFTPHVTTKAHGSGMGLFLAHRLATARYGGALRLEPRDPSEGGGTRAVVELGDRIRSGA